MKKLGLTVVFTVVSLFGLFLMAQVSATMPGDVPSAVAAIAPAATMTPASFLTPGFITMLMSIVVCLNLLLSAVQQIFHTLSKSEPGWLQTLSVVILNITKYLSANPDVPKTPPTP